MPSHARLIRRSALRLCVTLALTLGIAWSGASAAPVDLWITYDVPAAPPGGTAVETLTIGNASASASGPVRVTFATPAFINIDRTRPLPAGCAFVYENQDRTVPEVVSCVLPGLQIDEERRLAFGVAVHPTAPPISTWGMAAILPAVGSPDAEQYMTDNVTTPGVNIARPGPIGAGTINLYLAGDLPSVDVAAGGTQTFIVGNHGPGPTTGPVTVTMTTPFFVNVDRRRPLPVGCEFLLQNADPLIPEIVRCTLSAGLASGSPVTVRLPLARVAGGPVGAEYGIAAVATGAGSADVDPDRTDNVFAPGTLALASPTTVPGRSGRADQRARLARDAMRVSATSPIAADATAESVTAESVTAESAITEREVGLDRTPSLTTRGPTPARVDLTLSFDVPAVQPGDTVTETFLLSNRGQSTTAPVRFVYAMPGFVNIDRAQPLPPTCAFVYENADFTVNEIVACTLPGIARGQTIVLPIPLVVSPEAPGVLLFGAAIIAPSPGSPDREQFMGDNVSVPGVTTGNGTASPLPPGNRVDLYVTGDMPDLIPNAVGRVTFKVGNKGPSATQGVTRLTLITPMFVNVDRVQGLPTGCRFLFENEDPSMPEIVECLISGAIAPGTERLVMVPVRRVPGAPPGQLWATMIVRAQPGDVDVDLDLIDNFFAHGVVTSRPLPHHLRLFLHPDFSMRLAPPAPQLLSVNLLNAPAWLGEPLLNGLFEPESTFQVVVPCTLGLGVSVRYALSATDAAGGHAQPLGQTTLPLSLCIGTQVVSIPVVAPIGLANQRLKLTISSAVGLTLSLQLGSGAALHATNFAGFP